MFHNDVMGVYKSTVAFKVTILHTEKFLLIIKYDNVSDHRYKQLTYRSFSNMKYYKILRGIIVVNFQKQIPFKFPH